MKTSVSSIGTFMFSNYTDVPSTPMRPAQLTNASGQIVSNGDVDFQWAEQSYPTGLDYGNYPDGYRLYKDGQSVATAAFGTTSYTYAPSGTNSGNHQLTAYNADGEARDASTLDLGIDVTLSGDEWLDTGEQGTWTASVSGGAGTPTYNWEYMSVVSTTWASSNCTGASCSHTVFNYGSTQIE